MGVGKRIEKRELEHIAGDSQNVFMVADFRTLAGSISEGDSACADAQISHQLQIEESSGDTRRRRDSETGADDLPIEQKLENVQEEIESLGAVFDAGHIESATYYSEIRRLQLLQKHLIALSQAELISGKKPGKKQKDMEQLCPNLNSAGEATQTAATPGLRFTTSFICPKSCIWDEYVLYYPDDLLSL